MHHRRPARRSGTTLLFAALALVACRAPVEQRDATVEQLLREQSYGEAHRVALERVAADPSDADAARDLVRAQVAFELALGREHVFAGRVAEGYAVFLAIEPHAAARRTVDRWIEKCERMLAEKRRAAGWEAEIAGDFDEAAGLYRESVAYWPSDTFAHDGLDRIEQVAAWHLEQSADFYNNGVRDLRSMRMADARRNFEAAVKYLPNSADAKERVQEVRRMQADERIALAAQLSSDGLYHAAANELWHAKQIIADDPKIDELLAASQVEVDVLDRMGEADRLIRRGMVDEAIALLGQQLGRSELQAGAIGAAIESASEVRLAQLYERALELERDFDFEEAIDAYSTLLDESGGYYQDSIARRGTLRSYVKLAGELYAEYEAAKDDAARSLALRKIELFWPTYRDVPARLAALLANQP